MRLLIGLLLLVWASAAPALTIETGIEPPTPGNQYPQGFTMGAMPASGYQQDYYLSYSGYTYKDMYFEFRFMENRYFWTLNGDLVNDNTSVTLYCNIPSSTGSCRDSHGINPPGQAALQVAVSGVLNEDSAWLRVTNIGYRNDCGTPVPGAYCAFFYTSLGANSGNGIYSPSGGQYTFVTFDPQPAGTVPEPKSWVLLLLGFLGVGVGARRVKRRQWSTSTSPAVPCRS